MTIRKTSLNAYLHSPSRLPQLSKILRSEGKQWYAVIVLVTEMPKEKGQVAFKYVIAQTFLNGGRGRGGGRFSLQVTDKKSH